MNVTIAEFSMESLAGHSYNYASSIADRAAALGHRVRLLGSSKFSAPQSIPWEVTPLFDIWSGRDFGDNPVPEFMSKVAYRIAPDIGHAMRAALLARTMKPSFARLAREGAFTSGDLLLFPTMFERLITPVVEFAESLGDTCPKIALVFHFTAHPDKPSTDVPPHFRRAFQRLEKSFARDRFRLFAACDAIRDEFGAYTSLPLTVVPLPLSFPSELPATDIAEKPRLVFLGLARTNKGFAMLPGLLEYLNSSLGPDRIDAQFQAHRGPGSGPAEAQAAADLKRLGATLYEQPLTREEYWALIGGADIAVLPYTLHTYHALASAVFIEAVASGKPVVVTQGTWMGRQVEEGRAAGAVFPVGDQDGLNESVLGVLGDLPAQSARALALAGDWRAYHTPAVFWDRIVGAFEAGS